MAEISRSAACVGGGGLGARIAGPQLHRWGGMVITGQITESAALVKAQIGAQYADACEDFVCRCNFVTYRD